jgi:hypothetical protein
VAAQGWHLIPKDRSQPEPVMSIARSVAEILREHVTLELEGIDRMYLNVYVPRLQREAGVASFFRFQRGHRFASSVLMDPISHAFVESIANKWGQTRFRFRALSSKSRKPPLVASDFVLMTLLGVNGPLLGGANQADGIARALGVQFTLTSDDESGTPPTAPAGSNLGAIAQSQLNANPFLLTDRWNNVLGVDAAPFLLEVHSCSEGPGCPIPEPSSLSLFVGALMGWGGLVVAQKRRRNSPLDLPILERETDRIGSNRNSARRAGVP